MICSNIKLTRPKESTALMDYVLASNPKEIVEPRLSCLN
jgi:hypothetical protein